MLVITLCNVELLFHGMKPIISFQWISGMHEYWGTALQKFTTLYHVVVPQQLVDSVGSAPVVA
jgi:hypothetical protein